MTEHVSDGMLWAYQCPTCGHALIAQGPESKVEQAAKKELFKCDCGKVLTDKVPAFYAPLPSDRLLERN